MDDATRATRAELAGMSTGHRIRYFRRQACLSQRLLGDRVGRSGEWVKAVESRRLLPPRLPMLAQIAAVLRVGDVALLVDDTGGIPAQAFAGARHAALSEVQAALTDYRITSDTAPPNLPHLATRLRDAWRVRHSSPDHRTQLGLLLPDLIRDGQRAVRGLRGEERRQARRTLSGVYQLADFYVAYHPAPELVWLVADRALTEGQEADDPCVAAGGAWAMAQALRDAGRWEEAIALATDAAGQLTPHLTNGAPDDWRGMVGALDAEVAYVHARRGRHGDAWAWWELADELARRLGPGYRHVQSSFSQSVMAAHAVTLGVELRRPGEALRAADSLDPNTIPSLARRARHLIEVARAHHQREERAASWATLSRAERTAPETVTYNGYARAMLLSLRDRPPSGLREDVRDLCERVGVTE